jgi:phosphoribosylglycinamide formyltransferase-1
MISLAILASHNGSGFDAIYKAIKDASLDINIALVISNNPNATVIQKANSRLLPSYVVNATTDRNPDEKIYTLLKEHQCQYVFLSGYMKKLSPHLTNNFTIINSHPALLPKFGGSGMYGRYVHEAVLNSNESVSGVTIHEVNEFYDEGRIILQKELQIDKEETVESLENKIKNLEKIAIVEALKQCLK